MNSLGHETVSKLCVLVVANVEILHTMSFVNVLSSEDSGSDNSHRRPVLGLMPAGCGTPSPEVSFHVATFWWSVKGGLRWATSRPSSTSKCVLCPGWFDRLAARPVLLVDSLIP